MAHCALDWRRIVADHGTNRERGYHT